jgi:hypothetical protein
MCEECMTHLAACMMLGVAKVGLQQALIREWHDPCMI